MRRVDLLEKTDAGRDWGQEEKGTTEDELNWFWSVLPFPIPEYLSDPRVESASPVSPLLAGGFFTTELLANSLEMLEKKKKASK